MSETLSRCRARAQRFFSQQFWKMICHLIVPNKKARPKSRFGKQIYPRILLLRGGWHFFFLLLHQSRALAETLAEVSQLRSTDGTGTLHFNLVHAR
jgi:hypothetical protein